MKEFEENWYRGSGALRIGMKVYQEEWSVWLEMAKTFPGMEKTLPRSGKSKYDWENKLVFRLSRDDLGKLGVAFNHTQGGELLNLVHRYRSRSKTIKVILANNGNYFINGYRGSLGISIPLEADAVWKLRICLKLAYEESLCNENVFEKQRTCSM